MASRNVLAGVGGLTTGLFKGLSLGIGLRQHQQALDQRKAESEFQAYANILHAAPAKRPALFDLYIQSKGGDPSNAQFKPFKNLLSKIEDEEIGAFESALKGMLEGEGQPGEPAPQQGPSPTVPQAPSGLSTQGQINRLLLQRGLLQREGLM